jgi:hypothetical protein
MLLAVRKLNQTVTASLANICQECVSRFTQRSWGFCNAKKLLLLLLDNLNSGSNKNLAALH